MRMGYEALGGSQYTVIFAQHVFYGWQELNTFRIMYRSQIKVYQEHGP